MYEKPHATFVPSFITSLGQTTSARTVSYLVLESPAENVTKFVCGFINNTRDSPCTAGSMSMTSSLDLNSVTVELITTNMTFEVHRLVRAANRVRARVDFTTSSLGLFRTSPTKSLGTRLVDLRD
jgi:hypothetical protein